MKPPAALTDRHLLTERVSVDVDTTSAAFAMLLVLVQEGGNTDRRQGARHIVDSEVTGNANWSAP